MRASEEKVDTNDHGQKGQPLDQFLKVISPASQPIDLWGS